MSGARAKHELKTERVYEEPEAGNDRGILVDRLWPRGLTKEKANVDLWLKDIAPSTELRKWFGHAPEKWRSFRERYQTEFGHRPNQLKSIGSEVKEGTVTLVYGARDQVHNEAVVLKRFLEKESLRHPEGGSACLNSDLSILSGIRADSHGSSSTVR
ncbi:MAG TPA: DUF488 family protein [Nitrosospira sp.]|nr:DUF488 family protein [Nitrosospira sp.]